MRRSTPIEAEASTTKITMLAARRSCWPPRRSSDVSGAVARRSRHGGWRGPRRCRGDRPSPRAWLRRARHGRSDPVGRGPAEAPGGGGRLLAPRRVERAAALGPVSSPRRLGWRIARGRRPVGDRVGSPDSQASVELLRAMPGSSKGRRRRRWASTRPATARTSSSPAVVRPSSAAAAAAARQSMRSARSPSAPTSRASRLARSTTSSGTSDRSGPAPPPLAGAQLLVGAASARRRPWLGARPRAGGGRPRPARRPRRRRRHVDGQTEAVEELRAELALLGVHRSDEHEPGRVGVGEPVALDPVDARDGHVEQGVDEVVGEEVDLVDVEHAAVGGGEQAGPEPGRARR